MERRAIKKLIRSIKGLHENIKPSEEQMKHHEKFLELEREFREEVEYANMPLYYSLMEEKAAQQTESENTYFEEGFRMGLLIGIDTGRSE